MACCSGNGTWASQVSLVLREDLCSGLVFSVGSAPLTGVFVVIFILMGCFFVSNTDVHIPLMFVVTAVSSSEAIVSCGHWLFSSHDLPSQ